MAKQGKISLDHGPVSIKWEIWIESKASLPLHTQVKCDWLVKADNGEIHPNKYFSFALTCRLQYPQPS